MKEFSIAVLKYNNEDRIIYQVCAEFLRLSGIWVWEQLMPIEDSANEIDLENDPDVFLCNISDFNIQFQKDDKFVYNENIQQIIVRELEKAWENQGFNLEIKTILEVFLEYNLFTASLTLQYFKKENNNLVEKAGKSFEKAANKLKELLEMKKMKSKYLWYAKLYCCQKANLGADACKKQVPFYVDILIKECDAILKEYNDFINIYVLRGMANDIVEEEIEESLESYKIAVDKMSNEKQGMYPFLASIYYWIGKRCEGYNTFKKVMKQAYEEAYVIDRSKYRIAYKKAMISISDKEYAKGIIFFEECLKCLNKKGRYWDLLEQEYYFKVKVQMAYYKLVELEDAEACIGDLDDASRMYDRLEKGRRNSLKEYDTLIYRQLFGGEAESYLVEELKRMNLKQVQVYREKAYKSLKQIK